MLHRCFVHACKTLTNLQILGCELHQNAFVGRALLGATGEAVVLAPPEHSAIIAGGERERGRKGLEIGREGKGG